MEVLLGENATLEILNKFYSEQSRKMMLNGLRGVVLEYNLMREIQKLEYNPYSASRKEHLNAEAKEFFISEEKFNEFEKVNIAGESKNVLGLEECEKTENRKSSGCYSYFLDGYGQWDGEALYERTWDELDKLTSWMLREFPDRKKLKKFLGKFAGANGKYLLRPIELSHYRVLFDMGKLMDKNYSYPVKIFVYE